MTTSEAFDYVQQADMIRSEQLAEAGMGAVSLGFDPYDAMAVADVYNPATDPDYREAMRIIADYRLVHVVRWAPMLPGDDIPF